LENRVTLAVTESGQVNLSVQESVVSLEVSPYLYQPGTGGTGGGLTSVSLNPSQYPSFTLPFLPSSPSSSLLFIRGVKQIHGVDYNINGVMLTYTGEPVDYPATWDFYG
jgi:hypothetical protein